MYVIKQILVHDKKMNCFFTSFIQDNFLELFQGFQLITMLKPGNVPLIFGTNQTNQSFYLGSSSQVLSHISGLMQARPREEQTVCVKFGYNYITIIITPHYRPNKTIPNYTPDQIVPYHTIPPHTIPYHTKPNQTIPIPYYTTTHHHIKIYRPTSKDTT